MSEHFELLSECYLSNLGLLCSFCLLLHILVGTQSASAVWSQQVEPVLDIPR